MKTRTQIEHQLLGSWVACGSACLPNPLADTSDVVAACKGIQCISRLQLLTAPTWFLSLHVVVTQPLLALVLGAERIRIKDTYIVVVVRSRFIRYGIALLKEVSSVRKVTLRSSITYVLSSNMLKDSLPSRVEQSSANQWAVSVSGRTDCCCGWAQRRSKRNRKEPKQRATTPLPNPTATSKYEICIEKQSRRILSYLLCDCKRKRK